MNYPGRKRQRPFQSRLAPPPLLPSSFELDDTANSNPYKRHVAIHSPIPGIGNSLNLDFVAKIKSSKSHFNERSKMIPSCLLEERRSASSSSSYFTPASSSVLPREMDTIQIFFPIPDNALDVIEETPGDREQDHNSVSIGRMALKMRRRYQNNDNPRNIFEPTELTA